MCMNLNNLKKLVNFKCAVRNNLSQWLDLVTQIA